MELLPDFGNFLYTVVAFVVALSIIVTIHEFGHYIVGRWCGIRAEVFSLGFGPRLASRIDKRGMRWQIAAFPLGGYVKFLGDSDAASAGDDSKARAELTEEERRHTLFGAPLWARAATVAAGPLSNFVLSILIFGGIFLYQGTPTATPEIGSVMALPGGTGGLREGDRILALNGLDTPDYAALNTAMATLPEGPDVSWRVGRDGAVVDLTGPQAFPPRLSGVIPQSAAAAAGLREGDVITAIDGTPIWTFEDLRKLVGASDGKPLSLSVWRPGTGAGEEQRLTLTLTPKRMDMPKTDGGYETRWVIGATGGMVFAPATRPTGPVEALTGGAEQVWTVIASSLSAVKYIILGQISSCNLRGAVGIAQGSAAAAHAGFMDFIWFIGVLSTAVGFLNLFPVPVLDGGHLMFHLWEAVTGKPPAPGVLNMLTAIGLTLVLALMVFGLWNDMTCG